ncbi:MAG: MFS transporter [Bacillaceae bacterium]
MTNLLTIFKNRNYTYMLTSNFLSQMGSTIGMTAFMYYVLDRFTTQPAYASITELMYSLPTLFVFLFVGVVADRLDRKKVAANSEYICAAMCLLLLVAIQTSWMPLIFGILFLRSAVAKFFHPAEQALIQGVLTKDEYTTAAGLNQAVSSILMLFGTSIGVLVYWTVGVEGAIIVDLVSYLVSGILISICSIPKEVVLPNGKTKIAELKMGHFLKDFWSGIIYIVRYPLLFALMGGAILLGVVNGGFAVMPTFILKYKLAPSTYEEMMVVISIVFGVGILLGSILASIFVPKFEMYKAIIFGLVTSGLFVILAGFATNIIIFFIFIFLVALSIPIINVSFGGWLPHIVDPKMMGRVQGASTPLSMAAHTGTLAVITVAYPHALSIEMLFLVVGVALITVGIIYILTLPKYVKVKEVERSV